MAFETNIFINCPFDDGYKPILNSIIFTVICCGLTPRLSENRDSSESRLSNIQTIIEESKYSVHDLSRMEADKKGQLARFNMPFELGMDFGCKRYKGGVHSGKKLLVLDSERYRYQKALSDISGSDIADHNNSPEKAVSQVRNWLQKLKYDGTPNLQTSSSIWTWYNEFQGNFEALTTKADRDSMPWNEYLGYINQFLEGKKTSS